MTANVPLSTEFGSSDGGLATEQGEPLYTVISALRFINQELRISAHAAERRLGISAAQLFALQELAEKPAESLSELAARTYTRHSSASEVVSRLVERGLVSRERSTDDSRRVRLSVTPAGRTLLRGAPDAPESRLLASARRLSRARLEQLASSLEALRDVMDGDTKAPRGDDELARHATASRDD